MTKGKILEIKGKMERVYILETSKGITKDNARYKPKGLRLHTPCIKCVYINNKAISKIPYCELYNYQFENGIEQTHGCPRGRRKGEKK